MATNPEAENEVKEALLSFLQDNEIKSPDSAYYAEGIGTTQYNSQALSDAIVVIMDAFGFQATNL